MAKDYIKKYEGSGIKVSDEEIVKSSKMLSENTGIFAEPAAAAAFAGFVKFYEQQKLNENSINVVLLTGSGLKNLKSVQSVIKMPNKISPDIESLEKFLNEER